MQAFVRAWLGNDTPKQFCSFTGGRSMFQHTLDRASAAGGGAHTVAVVSSGQQHYVECEPANSLGGVMVQPNARGTLTATMLGLSKVMQANPDAVVHLLPADHFVFPTIRFLSCLDYAEQAVRGDPELIIMLGAVADYAETDYGWIKPSRGTLGPLSPVLSFHEKPTATTAARYLEEGYLWNTMICTFRARTLWNRVAELFPAIARAFEQLRYECDCSQPLIHEEHLSHIYAPLAELDLSRDLMERVADQAAVLSMSGVDWSDWGRPARIVQTLHQIGREPAFSPSLASTVIARSA